MRFAFYRGYLDELDGVRRALSRSCRLLGGASLLSVELRPPRVDCGPERSQ
jgi:hypothetical protein